jgi:hypothetical protein
MLSGSLIREPFDVSPTICGDAIRFFANFVSCEGFFMLLTLLRVGSLCAAFIVLGVSPSRGADEPKPPVQGEGRRAIPPEVLKKFDKNGNGMLDPDEREAARAERAKTGRPGGKPGEGRPLNPELIKRFDKDGDGKLNDAEIAAAKAERQKNGPAGGKPGERRLSPEIIKKFDKNGDGKLDDAEQAAAREEFKKNGPPGGRPPKRPEGAAPAKKPESK